MAASTVHIESAACQPAVFNEAYFGWYHGVCLTEEQIWCRAHPGRHPACQTADCRAEEIRLTLWRAFQPDGADAPRRSEPLRVAAYSDDCALLIHDHIAAMNELYKSSKWADEGRCGACVPESDRRAAFLPTCEAAQ